MAPRVLSVRERMERYVVKQPSGCWVWTGYCGQDGYGSFHMREKRLRAHRAVYEELVGPIPNGLVLDHLCRQKICVNPDHLQPVTIGENVMRGTGITATFAKRSHCSSGHAYDAENTRWRGNRRECRACDRIKYHRLKAAKAGGTK